MSNLWSCVVIAILIYATTVYCKTTLKTESATQPSTKDARDADVSEVDNALIMNDCNDTFRTEMSYIDSLNKSGSFPDETEKTPKCFVRCMLERNNVVSEEGVFDQEQALVFFTMQRPGSAMDDFRQSTEACSNRNETCICERSYRFVKCVVEMELSKKDL